MNHQAIQHCLCFPHSHLSFFSSFYWQHGLLKTDSDAEWLAHFFMTSRKYSFRNGNTPPSKIHTEGEKLGTKIIGKKKKITGRTSPVVVQGLRIHLPMQEIWVRSLVQEDSTYPGATHPVCHNNWACLLWSPWAAATEPVCSSYWSLSA